MPSKTTSAPFDLATLRDGMASIFDQVQVSAANHKKNAVALHKLHASAATVTSQAAKNGAVKFVGEEAFAEVFQEMIGRVLIVKKGTIGDRVVKFVGGYAKYVNDKALEEKAKHPLDDGDDDTLASRFFSQLLEWLFHGFLAKNKVVRFRSVQFVAEMISHLGELDEDMYMALRGNLIERVYDKESIIRVHATVALSKLLGSEDPNDVPPDEQSILATLLEVLGCDPASDVRRAALLNIPLTAETLDVLLSRTRDTDPLTRKLVYSSVLPSRLDHPRRLTIAQREQIVKHGLGDREPVVRLAAGKLVATWLDAIMVSEADQEEQPAEAAWEGDDGRIMKGLIAFLRIFDVVGPGEEIGVDALLSIFVTRPEYLDVFTFTPPYWRNLTAESALLARVFIEHCFKSGNEARLENSSIPVVTEFAFYVQEMYNVLLRLMQEEADARVQEDEDEEEKDEREEQLIKTEVVLGELLKIAVNLDFADEIGRRKMMSVMRDMLAHPQLPESLIPKSMDILRVITPSERELIRIIVEIVVELRDEDEVADFVNPAGNESRVGDDTESDIHASMRKERSMRRMKSRDDMSPEEAFEADIIDLRCLALCIAMLERVDGDFDDNSTLQGILSDLIIPAVKRKDLVVREKGLVSLGLCCLIAKNMALSSFQLFLNQVQSSPVDLRLKILQLVFDLLIMYEQDFFGRPEIAERIVTFLLQTLETDDSPTIQGVLCVGISKLLLAGFVQDPRVLTSLVLAYVSPATADNPELRQCLSYFFPMYCYSSQENQTRLRSVFITAFDQVIKVHEELEDDQEMITPHQFGLLLVDWLDPAKTAASHGQDETKPMNIHVDLAVDILCEFYNDDRTADHLKALAQLLALLSLSQEVNKRSVHKINIMLYYLQERRLVDNLTIEKMIQRFRGKFEKTFSKDLAEFDPVMLEEDEFKALFEYIGAEPVRYLKQAERDRSKRSALAEAEGKDAARSDSDAPSKVDHDSDGQVKSRSSKGRTTKPSKTPKKARGKSRAAVSDDSTSESPSEAEEDPSDNDEEDEEVSSDGSRASGSNPKVNGKSHAESGSEGAEEDEEHSPPSKARARRGPTKRPPQSKTRKSKQSPPRGDSSPPSESEDEESDRPTTPTIRTSPPGRRSKIDRSHTQPESAESSDQASEGNASHDTSAQMETPSPSDKEEHESSPVAHMTPMKKQPKRLRSPGPKQALMSPEHKRRSQPNGKSATAKKSAQHEDEGSNDSDASNTEQSADEEGDDEPQRSPSPTPVKRSTRGKSKASPTQEEAPAPPVTRGRGRGRGRARGAQATGRGRGRGKAETAVVATRATRPTRSSRQ